MDFLKDIYSEDIDFLINDVDLLISGYEINYVIDAYDIIRYSFPYGKAFSSINKYKPDDIGDLLISYDYILRNYDPVVLKEYELELVLTRNMIKVQYDKRLNSNVFENTLAKYKDNLGAFIKNIRGSATFMLATSLLSKSMLKVFDDLYNTKLQIKKLKLKNNNSSDYKIISKYFEEIKMSEWSKDVFFNWVESRSDKKMNVSLMKVYKSTLRDIAAIDRLCNINRAIQDNDQLNNKYLFLYYSGASKSAELFKNPEIINHLPDINGYASFNIHRAPKHSYLLSLIHDESLQIMRDTLVKFKNLISKRESVYSLLERSQSNDDLGDDFDKISRNRHQLLEFDKIASQINKHKEFQDKLHEKIQYLESRDNIEKIAEVYSSFLEDAKKSTGDIQMLQTDISYLLQGRLIQLIEHLNKNGEFNIQKGNDLIRGAYHHLPILLFFDQNSKLDNYRHDKLFLELINHVVASKELKAENFDEFTDAIKRAYYSLEKLPVYKEGFLDILLKVFIYIISKKPESKNERDAYEVIKKAFILLETDKESFFMWGDDYLYFLASLSRRLQLFEDSKRYFKRGIKIYPKDPRFYHQKCLVRFNILYTKGEITSCSRDSLIQLVSIAEHTIKLYKECKQNPDYRTQFFQYVDGSIAALKNLVLYCISVYYLQILESNNDINQGTMILQYSIDNLRNSYLKDMKQFEATTHNPKKSWSENSHTEAVFELVEGIYYQSIPKLQHSFVEIERVLEKEPNDKLYINTKAKIEFWLKKLRKK